MVNNEESCTPPLPPLFPDDGDDEEATYTPPLPHNQMENVKITRNGKSSKKEKKFNGKKSEKDKKSKKPLKSDKLKRKSSKNKIEKKLINSSIRYTTVFPSIQYAENPKYCSFVKSTTPEIRNLISFIEDDLCLTPKIIKSPGTPPIIGIAGIVPLPVPLPPLPPVETQEIELNSPNTDEYETKWESDEDSALRKNLHEYYDKIDKAKNRLKIVEETIEIPMFEKQIGNEFEEFLKNEKLKIQPKDSTTTTTETTTTTTSPLTPTTDSIQSVIIEKKFSMSLKNPVNLAKFPKPIIKTNIFFDDVADDNNEISTIKSLIPKKIDEIIITVKEPEPKKHCDQQRRSTYKSSSKRSSTSTSTTTTKRSPSPKRNRSYSTSTQRRGERGERKINENELSPIKDRIVNYDFSTEFNNLSKKPIADRKLSERDAANCSQHLNDYLNPVFTPVQYQLPLTDNNSINSQWSSLDARLEMIKNDYHQPINTTSNYIHYSQQYSTYQQPIDNYMYDYSVAQNSNLIPIQSAVPSEDKSNFKIVGNVLEIVPTIIQQPPLPPPPTENMPPLPPLPPPPQTPKPVPPPTISVPILTKKQQKLDAKRQKNEEKARIKEIRMKNLKGEVAYFEAHKENRLREEIQNELLGSPVKKPITSILLNHTVTTSTPSEDNVLRSFRQEKQLRSSERSQKSVIYRDTVKPNYDEEEVRQVMIDETKFLRGRRVEVQRRKRQLGRHQEKIKKNEEEIKIAEEKAKNPVGQMIRRKKTVNLMDGFSVPKPVLKLIPSSTATAVPETILELEPRKPESADLMDSEYYDNLPPPPPPPGRPPSHLPQPVLNNPEPDTFVYFHAYEKTGQFAISPFPEDPDWPLIKSKLKDDGTALVCTPNMIQRDPRRRTPETTTSVPSQMFTSPMQLSTDYYGKLFNTGFETPQPPYTNYSSSNSSNNYS